MVTELMADTNCLDRKTAANAWGVHLAFWLLVVLGFLCWTIRADEPDSPALPSIPVESPHAPTREVEETALQGKLHAANEADENLSPLNKSTSVETDWRRTRQGWLRLSQASAIEPQPQNLVQRISPLFWAVWLWLISTWILVWST